jgi:predicted component of type VI protein secretion system
MDMNVTSSAGLHITLFLALALAGCQTAEPAPLPRPSASPKTAGVQPIAGARLNPLTARSGRIEYVAG